MKMGNLNEEAWMNAAEARLIGALIGLARATDGNTVRTEETGRLMRVGLAALTQGEQKEFYEAMVEKALSPGLCNLRRALWKNS